MLQSWNFEVRKINLLNTRNSSIFYRFEISLRKGLFNTVQNNILQINKVSALLKANDIDVFLYCPTYPKSKGYEMLCFHSFVNLCTKGYWYIYTKYFCQIVSA